MLRTRVLTGIVLAVIVLVSVFGLPPPSGSVVFGVFWIIGADEWARLVRFAGLERRAYVAVFAALIVAVILAGAPPWLARALFAAAAVAWLFMLVVVLRVSRPLPQLPMALLGLLVLAAAWLAFHQVHTTADTGPGLIVAGLAIVWCADIGAFFVGRTLGHMPLAPRISPKKTWEGVAGGVALAVVAGVVAALLLDLPLAVLAPLAGAMALISVVGDLSVSLLKRQAGLKDAGMLLPGHGGVMDRFDGVTAALPFFVLGLQFAHVLD